MFTSTYQLKVVSHLKWKLQCYRAKGLAACCLKNSTIKKQVWWKEKQVYWECWHSGRMVELLTLGNLPVPRPVRRRYRHTRRTRERARESCASFGRHNISWGPVYSAMVISNLVLRVIHVNWQNHSQGLQPGGQCLYGWGLTQFLES